ncbi:hypothetical protein [Afipia felis]|uniref:Uncharacterized protein n=2 Tax=Afipia felis TaxID=1035 RepID=A0A380WAS1_AFIFE|nr:hypothetical protein [Afipia felis]EKS29268.1 hypothetical protein HMPREF9697_01796 [Afipia felis ATCC 53690]SUU77976.1 Uncharacterised protein [Afipia felis]SUU86041.1 Uncharacterised protein [Afipia felis]
MYVVHDEFGNILHSINGPDANYGKTMTDAGDQWIFLEGEFSFNPVEQYVDVEKKAAGVSHNDCLCNASEIPLAADKTSITANGADIAKISSVPVGAKVTIISDVGIEFDDVVSDGEIELSASDQTTYIVHVTAGAKYLPTSVQVVAQ